MTAVSSPIGGTSARTAGVLVLLSFVVFLSHSAIAQTQLPSAQPAQTSAPATAAADQDTPELASRDAAATFKVNVRLVVVRVVVRDDHGKPVGNLRKEDFQLLDDHRPQVISQFSVEHPGSQVAREQQTTEIKTHETPGNKPPDVPERFIAYLFDDVHVTTQDLLPARNAADRRVSAMEPTDRAAIFTTSGQGNLDFTDDHAKLHQALLRIISRPLNQDDFQQCPYMSYYMADLIVNKQDPEAVRNATNDALQCAPQPLTPTSGPSTSSAAYIAAQTLAESAAMQQLTLGDSQTHLALVSLKSVIRRMSTMPGQRTVVFVSPGFITPQLEYELADVIDQALRTNVIVSSVDARGLYVPAPFGDISQENVPNAAVAPREVLYQEAEAEADDNVLSSLAESTGGVFFHNNNDLEGGLKRAAETPEFYYVLGFSPQNLKYDGTFHYVNVKLNHPAHYTLQARKGYYAPKQAPNAEDEAKQEIEDAVFSQEETHNLPVDLHTQFFKPSDLDAKLAVMIHIDAKRLHFRKEDGRNKNSLTIVAALFDRNGTFISGDEKILDMRWKDETLEHKLQSGVTLKTNFDVKPGSYLVRLVVRDTEGLLATENGAIEIP